MSECTGALTSTWSVSVASRYGQSNPALGYITYRLNVELQGGLTPADSAQLSNEIVNVTATPITRGAATQAQQT